MKRGLRVATGILLLLTMLLFSMNLSALAGGDQNTPSDDGGASAPAPSEERAGKRGPAPSIERMASTPDIIIKSNTTVTTKTYNSDVVVNPNVELKVGTNGNVVVNGNLIIGGTVRISSGKLTVNGDIWVYGKLLVGGTAKVIVNKAPKVNSANGVPQYGGSLVITDYYEFGSTMVLNGSAAITVNYAQKGGFYVQDGGSILVNSASSKITVNNNCYFGGTTTKGSLIAGTLEVVNGWFYQSDEYSDYAFCPNPAFKVVLKSTNNTVRSVDFDSPLYSHFTNLAVSGYKFDTGSLVPVCRDLTADYSLNCNSATICYQGKLNGKRLTLTGNYVMINKNAETVLGGGTLTVNGDLDLDSGSLLIMNNANDKLIVNGYLLVEGALPSLTAGQITINGNFFQMTENFTPGPNILVKITGANRSVKFDNPDTSYFTKFQIDVGASFTFDSVVSVNCGLESDVDWTAIPSLYYRGSLNGHDLLASSVTVPAGASVTLGGGRLFALDNLALHGSLIMNAEADFVLVGGNMTADGASSAGNLTAGRLVLMKDFTQSGAADSFDATGNHKTILGGDGAQAISFASSSSGFAKLYVTNNTFDVATLPAGCYDSLTVTGVTLDKIDVSAGTLTPAFSANTDEYMLLLPTGTDSVVITPALLARYGATSWLTFDDGTAPATEATAIGVPLDGSTTVRIVAHAADDVLKRTTTVKVERINANLKAGAAGLGTLPAGAVPGGADAALTVDLPATMASVNFAPVADNPDSTVSVDGAGPTKTVTVAMGGTVTCNVVVTAQDGTTNKTYTVVFKRHQPLSGLTVSSGKLTFNPATASYSVTAAASSVTLTAAVNSADCSTVTMDGEATLSKTVALAPGKTTTVTVAAQDKDGKTATVYTVKLTTLKLLSGIKLSKGSLSPAFSAGKFAYTVCVPNTTASVTVTPVKAASCTSMKINGKKVASVKLAPKPGSSARATIVCTSGTGATAVTQTYTVTVYRIQPVSKISVSTGKLSPKFSVGKYSYSVSLPANVSSVKISVAKNASCKLLTINGAAASSIKLTPALGGSATARIVATAQNGARTTYTVTVRRAAVLKGITLSTGKLSPAFKPGIMAYNVTVPSTTRQVTVTPVKLSGVKSIAINGKVVKSVTLKPAPSGFATATVVVTAGGAKFTYKVTVYRQPLLTGINTSAGTLSPAFEPGKASYALSLPADTDSVTLTPVKGSAVKTLTIDGVTADSATFTPAPGATVTVTIVATATDNVTKATYTVTITRAS